ncbi:MAG: HAD-IA family hydrolase, partial [Bacteroidota bacterium]
KNAVSILEQVDLIDYFESVIDGTKVVNGKPHPEGFLLAAKEVGVAPANCVVFEDAPKGVEAALSAEMFAVGIGKEEDLDAAHLVLPSFENRNFKQIEEQLLSLALR